MIILECDVTYIVLYLFSYFSLSTDNFLFTEPESVHLIQLKTFILNLISQMCELQVFAGLPIYMYHLPITSYLRLSALSILTCSQNMSTPVRLVLENSRSLETFELGHCPLQPPLRK